MKYKFIIPGNPIPLARPRINNKSFIYGKQPRMWNPQKELKLIMSITMKNQYEHIIPLKGPVHIEAIFYMSIPKSLSPKKQDLLDGTYHIKKPDIDNLIKLILDASTSVIFHDDCIIASITAKKIYDLEPRTEFTVSTIME